MSFVFRNWPRDKKRDETRILEIGCGSGNNLWFAAREGFAVSGIDASPSAIAYAETRFQQDGLRADLRVGSFDDLPFREETFDLALDRFALSCCGHSVAIRAVQEVRRVLRPGGRFLCTPLSTRHSQSSLGKASEDGLRSGVPVGDSRLSQLAFYSREQVAELFGVGWKTLTVQHAEITNEHSPENTYAEWRVVAERIE